MREQALYYRSRATHKRLHFLRSEIFELRRDGYYGQVRLVNGAIYRVLEVEPEHTENVRGDDPALTLPDDHPIIPFLGAPKVPVSRPPGYRRSSEL